MGQHSKLFTPICALLLVAFASLAAQGGDGKGPGKAGFGVRRASHFARTRTINPLGPVPITRPVDLVWPPVIIEPPEYETGAMEPPSGSNAPAPAREFRPSGPEERGVEIRLDDCMENARAAGYSFSARSVVSCEDSSVDVYLSYNENGGYYFLVPEDTQIKDAGSRYDIRNVRLIKPGNWSPDHAAPLTAGHAYIVWASTGDLYLLHVEALWDKHVMFSWLWHSRLSREDAEKFLRDNAAGPPGTPYFAR